MKRIFTALISAAAIFTMATPSFATAATPKPAMAMPMAKVTPAGNHTCPKGETYVKGYKKADGTKVKGYCRKA
jgi:hypothetical protein